MRYVRSCRNPEARDIQRHGIRRTSGARLERPACCTEDELIRPKSAPPTNIRHRERGRPSDPASCELKRARSNNPWSEIAIRPARISFNSAAPAVPRRLGFSFWGPSCRRSDHPIIPIACTAKAETAPGSPLRPVTPRKSPPAIAAGCRPPRAPRSSARTRPPCACRTPRASSPARPRRPWSGAPAPPLRRGCR